MKTRKTILSVLISTFIVSLVVGVYSAFPIALAQTQQSNSSVWTGTSWTESTEEGTGSSVYTASGAVGNVQELVLSGGISDNTLIEYDLRINSASNGDDTRNITLVLTTKEGDTLKFQISPRYSSMYVKWSDHRLEGVNYNAVTTDSWNKAVVKVGMDYVSFTFGGKTIEKYYTGGVDFTGAQAKFSCWGMLPSVKNITLSKTQLPTPQTEWYGSFTTSTENGETIYTSPDSYRDLQYLVYNGNSANYNVLSFDLKWGQYAPKDGHYFIVYVRDQNNKEIAFQFEPYFNAVFIYENGVRRAGENYETDDSGWFNVKLVFARGASQVLLNDEVVASSNLNELKFTNAKVNMHAHAKWVNNASFMPSVKNMAFGSVPEAELPDWVADSHYDIVEETVNGKVEQVYSRNNFDVNAATYINYNGEESVGNSFSLSFREDGKIISADSKNFGVFVYPDGDSGTFYEFSIWPYFDAAYINYYKNGSNCQRLIATNYEDPNQVEDEDFVRWNNLEVVYDEGVLLFYINGELILRHFDTADYTFNNPKIKIFNWGVKASFTGMQFKQKEINYVEVGFIDLDFVDPRGVLAVEVEGGTLGYDHANDQVCIDVEEENPVITVFADQTPGSHYSAFVDVRNTILVRMQNATSADKVNLHVYSQGNQEWVSNTFDVNPNEKGMSTYYFSIDNLDVVGYLVGLKLEFPDVTEGQVIIDCISFEREDAYDYAAEEVNLTADPKTKMVTFSGKLKARYANKTVKLLLTDMSNYQEILTYQQNQLVLETTADKNGNFKATFPLIASDGIYNHLTSMFLASVDGEKLSQVFNISNWRDFVENPFGFTLPDLSVDVTEARFGAVGDGFTNDNTAIQSAIDYVSAQGGGKVIIPGDKSSIYGRRFIVTNLEMRNNVELHMEEGAVLWQSPRLEDYKYDVIIGHNVPNSGIMWNSACNVNRPLILFRNVQNAKLTGKGTIRMEDAGSEETYPLHLIDPSYSIACHHTIHLCPLFVSQSKNIELTDFTILRTSNWNITTNLAENLFIGGVTMKQVIDSNSDGIGLTNARNVLLVCNRLYGNDDAITLNGVFNDPRKAYDWNKPDVDGTRATENIEIAYNQLRGGLGLVFCSWASGHKDISVVTTKNIVFYNNVIGGTDQSIGGWTDNPFYGWSQGNSYVLQDGEEDDYSPIQDVYMFNNVYYNGDTKVAIGVYSWKNRAPATNFVTDSKLVATTQFLNPSFEREFRYKGEEEWLSGLAYWTTVAEQSATFGYQEVGQKVKTAKYDTDYTATVKDYAGYVTGTGKMYQGIYLYKGWYTFTVNVCNQQGSAEVFFGKPVVKKHISDLALVDVIKSAEIAVSQDFTTVKLTFKVEEAGVYALGVGHAGEGKILLDDVSYYKDEETGAEIEKQEEEIAVKAERQLLLETLAGLEDKDLSNYTAESIQVLEQAIAEAQAGLDNLQLTSKQIKQLRLNVTSALEALEEIPQESEVASDTESEESENPSSEVESSSTTESSSDTSSKSSSCKGMVGGGNYLLIILSCIVALAFIVKRNRKEEL